MKNLKSCIGGISVLIRPAMGRISVTVLLGLMRIALSLFFVWVCKQLVDIATGVSDQSLSLYVTIMISVVLLRVFVATAASYVESYNSLKTTNKIRYQLFSHVLGSEWKGKETFLSGDTVNRLEEDVRVIVDLMVSKIPEVLVTMLQLFAASVYLMTLSPSLMWVLLILMAVAALSSKLFFLKIRQLSSQIRALDSSVQQLMQENIQNRAMVLTLVGTSRVLSRLASLQSKLEDNTLSRLNMNSIARGCLRFGFMAGYASAFLWGIFGIRDGVVTYGMMTAFLQLVNQVQMPIVNLSSQIPSFIHSLSSIERIMELQELPSEIINEDHMFSSAPEIKAQNLSFSYEPQSRLILSDFNFIFPAGRMTVISGPTGAGKSTLIKLMLALLRPVSGSIMIDDMPISPDTRCNFMYVPQGNTLMSGTIRENLMLSNPAAKEDEIINALKTACAEFVFEKEKGIETFCSEDGAGLSEGQAQRIAIARALLHPGNVLILDESTSSLDSETEGRVLNNLHNEYHGRKTIIFISHRPAVYEYADATLELL